MFRVAACLLAALGGAWAQAPVGAVEFGWEQRWQHYLHRTYSWQRMSLLAFDSGVDHLLREPSKWGRGPRQLGYRYGSLFTRRVARNTVELGAGALLDEDTRFRRSGSRALGRRIQHAFLQSFLAYRDDRQVFAYSRLAGTASGIVVMHQLHGRPLSAERFFNCTASAYIDHLQNSFLTEFSDDLKAFGRRIRSRILHPGKETQ